MRHDIVLDGLAFRLRPVSDSDAQFILDLRSNPELSRYLHSTSNDLQSQLDWLASYYDRAGDYYFLLERKENFQPEGLISLYDLDLLNLRAEWGRWILRPGSTAAVESVWLIYQCAFNQLKLREVFCRTVALNASVVSFHDSCGIKKRKLLSGHFNLNGQLLDAVEHCVDQSDWPLVEPHLKNLTEKIARRLKK